MTNTINQAGLDLIKQFESCSLTAYPDVKGIWTQGWGHTGSDVTADSTPVTQEQADAWLEQDVSAAEDAIDQNITAALSANQFSALVSLVYNCGPGPVTGGLGMYLNAGNLDGVAVQWLRWDHAGGQAIRGLTLRREAELALFQTA